MEPSPVGPPETASKRSWRRAAGARVALYGGFLGVGVPWALSFQLTAVPRQPASPVAPPFEERFVTSEGLRLRTWLLRPEPRESGARAAVVVVHGLGDSLESFTGVARRLAARGHAVLLLDLRGHGGSQAAHCTLGARERGDVRAALHWLRAQGLTRGGAVLLGNSLGAVAVLLAAADEVQAGAADDLRALVAEAPFDSYRETAAHHARLLYGIPRWLPLAAWTVAIAEWRAGFDADSVDTLAAAARLDFPVLLIADGEDARMPESVVRRVAGAHAARGRAFTEVWVAPGMPHSSAAEHPDYWPRVLGFFERAGI